MSDQNILFCQTFCTHLTNVYWFVKHYIYKAVAITPFMCDKCFDQLYQFSANCLISGNFLHKKINSKKNSLGKKKASTKKFTCYNLAIVEAQNLFRGSPMGRGSGGGTPLISLKLPSLLGWSVIHKKVFWHEFW